MAGRLPVRPRRGVAHVSFDLAFWHAPGRVPWADAPAVYDALLEESCGAVPEHPAAVAFAEAVVGTFGDLTEDLDDDAIEAVPWTSPVCCTPGGVLVAIGWRRAPDVAPVLLALAAEHGLTTFDPQTESVHAPDGHVDGPPEPEPEPVPYFRFTGTSVVLATGEEHAVREPRTRADGDGHARGTR